jgi:FtsP/CotA-like multicopper oxidase with cupredoxin domain
VKVRLVNEISDAPSFPRPWMADCHIAEHHESGMIFGFEVEDAA